MNAPYREAASAGPSGTERYVPRTRKEDFWRRKLFASPVLALIVLAFVLGRPWLLACACAYALGAVILDRLSARSLNLRLKAVAGTLARGGDAGVAAKSLEAIVADAPRYPRFHAVSVLLLAIARLRSGNGDGALELLYVVEKSEWAWVGRRKVWQISLIQALAELHAARGEIDLARQWIEKAPERRNALASAKILVAVRGGRFDDAIARIDDYLRDGYDADASSNAVLTTSSREHFALLRAFACERTGRAFDHDAVRRLASERLASRGRVALPLECFWVDFAQFLETHATADPA